jgi:membrane protease YdiL (CAAX protease family)
MTAAGSAQHRQKLPKTQENKMYINAVTVHASAAREPESFSPRALLAFLLITFALAWGILALFIFFPEQMTARVGQLSGRHPLFFLAVYSPAIAAWIIVAHHAGPGGFRRYLCRAMLWRCSPGWWAFLLIGIPVIFIAGSWYKGNLFTEPLPFSSWQALLTGLFFAAIKGPVEEFGWRGLALPLLQQKFTPLLAGLILGVIWGFWHLPAFLLSGTEQSEWAFAPFFLGCIALSVIVTQLFNASRGSILLPAVFHFTLMNPVFPDAEPYDTWLLIAVAAGVVWFNRQAMLTRHGAVTEVIPQSRGRVNR